MNHTSYLSYTRVQALFRKECLQLWENKVFFYLLLIFPILQIIVSAHILNGDVKNLTTVVVNQDNSPHSRTIIAAIKNTGYFQYIEKSHSLQHAEQLMASGKVAVIIYISSDFSRKLIKGEQPEILVEADGSTPLLISVGLKQLFSLERLLFTDLAQSVHMNINAVTPFKFVALAKYNPLMLPAYATVPGILSLVLAMFMAGIGTMTFTAERENKTLEGLLITPLTAGEIILGKGLLIILIAYVHLISVLIIENLLFKIPFHGSILLLLLISLIFFVAIINTSILLSLRAKNQIEAISYSNIYGIINTVFSGFAFPLQGMPLWAQQITEFLPLTHFIKIVSGILIKGNTFSDLLPTVTKLIFLMLVTGLLAVKFHQKSLDN